MAGEMNHQSGSGAEPVIPDNVPNDGIDNQQQNQDGIQDEQQGSQGQNQIPDFDPKSWELDYKGQKIYPKDRNHLITLARQGFGASQQLDLLNKERQQIEQLKNQYTQYDRLDQAFKQNPKLAQRIQQFIIEYQQNPNADEGQNQDELDPRILQMHSKLEELEQWRQQALQSDADKRLQQELQELKNTHKQYDWTTPTEEGTLEQRILKHALEKGITDLGLAFKDIMWDSVAANSQAEALKKAQERQQQQHRAGVVQNGAGGKPQAQSGKLQYNPSDTYNDIVQKAKSLMT